MKSLLNLSAVLALVLIVMVGCGNSDRVASANYVDKDKEAFIISGQNLTYSLAPDSVWMIAPSENLPEQFDMCVVDTVSGVCVAILEPETGIKVSDLSPVQINTLVDGLTQSNVSRKYRVKSRHLQPTVFMDESAWKYRTVIEFEQNGAVVEVLYEGRIFNGASGICALVVTGPNADLDLSEYIARIGRKE